MFDYPDAERVYFKTILRRCSDGESIEELNVLVIEFDQGGSGEYRRPLLGETHNRLAKEATDTLRTCSEVDLVEIIPTEPARTRGER